ncbi:MAG: isoprenyl transferase [Atopostipes suicloacalis]|nr:isoprenyl transferase [Atopostipes suicloacalis]MDN6731676.1 isoprenyl transferase [Atopostipes suicloacalis]
MTNEPTEKLMEKEYVPNHVAIIMDGNGRWAESQGLERSVGHQEGVEAIRRVSLSANKIGIKVLTLYAFSTENWKRPLKEIQFLMKMPGRFFKKFIPELMENNVKVMMTGFEDRIPDYTKRDIFKAIEKTKNNTGMILNFAFNYGGRAEITEAVRQISKKLLNEEIKAKDIDEDLISKHLQTSKLGEYQDVDFLIRTSGEQRLSNFLLWQNAYSEFYFSPEYWPEYDHKLFVEAIRKYQSRNRRFGGL